MINRVLIAATLLTVVSPSHLEPPTARWQEPPSPMGRWISADKDHVMEIARCDSGWCATTLGVVAPTDKAGAADPSCNKLTLSRLQWHADRKRFEGVAHDPDSDATYKAWLKVNAGRLEFRAWKGVEALGKTYRYGPFAGRIGVACRIEDAA